MSSNLATLDWWPNGPVQVPATAEDGGIDPDGGTLLECFTAGGESPVCRDSVQAL